MPLTFWVAGNLTAVSLQSALVDTSGDGAIIAALTPATAGTTVSASIGEGPDQSTVMLTQATDGTWRYTGPLAHHEGGLVTVIATLSGQRTRLASAAPLAGVHPARSGPDPDSHSDFHSDSTPTPTPTPLTTATPNPTRPPVAEDAPAITSAPRSICTVAGRRVTVDVAPSGPVTSYAWQVQRHGAWRTVATTSSWSVRSRRKRTLAVRVVVTGPGGTATSSTVTLSWRAERRRPANRRNMPA